MAKTLSIFLIIAVIFEAVLAILWVSNMFTKTQFNDYSLRGLTVLLIVLVVSIVIQLFSKKQ